MTNRSKSYIDRTDIEKILSNWKKVAGLYSRKEWSSSVVRAATAAEIATNLAVREELENSKGIDEEFVSHLMIWANGIQGKYQKLILPSVVGKGYETQFKLISADIGAINRERNKIVHGGYFANSLPAYEIIVKARKVILELVKQYDSDFYIEEIHLIEE